MFSLRRAAVTATYARPASAFSTATFNTTRHARPQNLSELRSFESLLSIRFYSYDNDSPSYGGDRPSYGDRPAFNDRGGRGGSYNNNRGGYGGGRGGGRGGSYNMNRGQDRSFPTEPTKVIYVGNFRFDTTEQALRDRFAEFGTIEGVKLAPDHQNQGLSRGYGWVEFESVVSAAEAVEKMHSAPFEGRPLSVQYVSHKLNTVRENPPSNVLFLGNLPYNLTDEDLDELFKGIDGCLDVRIAVDRRTGQPRGFAHADFRDVETATAAKEKLTGTQVYGRTIRTDFSAVPEWKQQENVNNPDRFAADDNTQETTTDAVAEAEDESTEAEADETEALSTEQEPEKKPEY